MVTCLHRGSWPALALIVLSLIACGGAGRAPRVTPPLPSAPATGAAAQPAPSGPIAAPAPAAIVPPSYRAQNQAFGTLRGFTVPPVVRRPPFRLVHVACELDETAAAPGHACRVVSAAAARAAYPDGESSQVLAWLRSAVRLTDGKAPRGLAAAVTRFLDDGTPFAAGAQAVVALTVATTTLEDEFRASGCESAHARGMPCDPIAMPTGRKVKRREVSGPVYVHQGRSLDLYVGVDALVALVGGAVVYQPVELALIFGDGSRAPYLALLQQAMNPGTARAAVATLATVVEPDAVVRQILAYDRAVVAARLGDRDATVAAVTALEAELARGPTPSLEPMVKVALPFLRRIASGELVFTAPAGLADYVQPSW